MLFEKNTGGVAVASRPSAGRKLDARPETKGFVPPPTIVAPTSVSAPVRGKLSDFEQELMQAWLQD